MGINVQFPTVLWLLVLLLPLWLMAWVAPQRKHGLWLNLGLRSLLIVSLILSLAGVEIERNSNTLTTVFLVDHSASITPAMRARANAFVQDAIKAMPATDQAVVVAFGANAVVERSIAQNATEIMPNTGDPTKIGTNIQAALQLGIALLPSETNKRLVLLSDGGENAGSAQRAAQIAAAQNIPLSFVDLGEGLGSPEVQVSELQAPTTMRQGQALVLKVMMESSVAQVAHLRILGDGKLITERNVQLAVGTNRVEVQLGAQLAGVRRFRAEVTAAQDSITENNAAEALTQIIGIPRVLLVEGQPGRGKYLQSALAAAQIQSDVIAPQNLPQGLVGLSAYEAIALINVPVKALPANAQETLPAYVHDLGRGLLMIGGGQSFGLGGYNGTPIEQALPVSMDVRQTETRPNLAIVYVLDKSSSMQACHCRGPSREKDGYYDHQGRTKLEIGKDAVVRSVAVLDPRDVVGVVAFDGSVHWAFQPVAQAKPDAVLKAIAPLEPNGHETNVGIGLRAAEDALAKTDARIKHVILLTDGWSDGEDPVSIIKEMHSQGMTVSVVAEGLGSSPNLQQMADTGGGRYFAVKNMEDALQIFVQETRQVSQNFIIEHPFTPQYGVHTPILAGLDQGLPKLYGYNGTTPKQTASVALADADGTPVLAQWQYGLGRSVAWTSDTAGRWSKDWLAWSQFPRFAAQMMGWVLPSAENNPVQLTSNVADPQTTLQVTLPMTSTLSQDGLTLRATLLGPDGKLQEMPLVAQAAGIYQATIDTPPQGTYLVQVLGEQQGQVVLQNTGAFIVPYASEYRIHQSNPALLETLAHITGGGRLAQPIDAFAPVVHQNAHSVQDMSLPALFVALLLLPIDILVRRLIVLWRTRLQ